MKEEALQPDRHTHPHEDGNHIHYVGRMNALLGIGQVAVGAFGSKTLTAAGLHNLSDWASYRLKKRSSEKSAHEGRFDRYAATAVMVLGGGAILGAEAMIDTSSGAGSEALEFAEYAATGAELGVAGASLLAARKMSGERAVVRDAQRHVVLVDSPAAVITSIGVVGGNLLDERFDAFGLVAHAGLLIGAAALSLRDKDHH